MGDPLFSLFSSNPNTREDLRPTAKTDKGGNTSEEEPTNSLTPAQAALKAGRIERTQLYLDEWLRGALTEHLPSDEATRYMILLWVGAGAPEDRNYNFLSHDSITKPDFQVDDKLEGGIDIVLKRKLDHTAIWTGICSATINLVGPH